jgi:hypothetical protein
MFKVLIVSAIVGMAYLLESHLDIVKRVGQADQSLVVSQAQMNDRGILQQLPNRSVRTANFFVEQAESARLDASLAGDYMTANGDFIVLRQLSGFISRINQSRMQPTTL